jgi:hypothetical protein
MAMTESQNEPTMEEILASIRRIIAEEDTTDDSILDLSDPADVAPTPAAVEAVAADGADDLLVFDSDDEDLGFDDPFEAPAPAVEAPAPAAAAAAAVAPAAAGPASPLPKGVEETLLSDAVATATASALARLAGTLRIADSQGQTLEGLVRELLAPMLKQWLDENLHAIVEAKVEAALERVARLAR